MTADRAHALAEMRRNDRALSDLRSVSPEPGRRLGAHTDLYARRLGRAQQQYLAWLPFVAVSRCPFSGVVVRRSVDDVDIDGPWWDSEEPLRPREPWTATLIGFTGALQLAEPVVDTDQIVLPGPAVPVVHPAVLADESVTAVLSQVPIGPHAGYITCYFTADDRPDLLRPPDWGRNNYVLTSPEGEPEHWGEPAPEAMLRSIDLTPWLRSGRLRWIAPGDNDLVLRDGEDDCPYLDLPGTSSPQVVRHGRVASIDPTPGGAA